LKRPATAREEANAADFLRIFIDGMSDIE